MPDRPPIKPIAIEVAQELCRPIKRGRPAGQLHLRRGADRRAELRQDLPGAGSRRSRSAGLSGDAAEEVKGDASRSFPRKPRFAAAFIAASDGRPLALSRRTRNGGNRPDGANLTGVDPRLGNNVSQPDSPRYRRRTVCRPSGHPTFQPTSAHPRRSRWLLALGLISLVAVSAAHGRASPALPEQARSAGRRPPHAAGHPGRRNRRGGDLVSRASLPAQPGWPAVRWKRELSRSYCRSIGAVHPVRRRRAGARCPRIPICTMTSEQRRAVTPCKTPARSPPECSGALVVEASPWRRRPIRCGPDQRGSFTGGLPIDATRSESPASSPT